MPALVPKSPSVMRGAEIRANLKALLERQRAAFIRHGQPPLDERRKDLVKLKKLLRPQRS
jgi:hypothetical protein